MIAFRGPVEFLMGSPESVPGRQENEKRHLERISRSFAFAATHVTFDQYRKFDGKFVQSEYGKNGDCPATLVSWHAAATYCNWLSKKEGFEECYEIEDEGIVTKMKSNYLNLSEYRLPTEAEWEFAVRAEAGSDYSFGTPEGLLKHYCWYDRNTKIQLHPVSTLKPNDFGLFDGHGNAWCWCQDNYIKKYPTEISGKPPEDSEHGIDLKNAKISCVAWRCVIRFRISLPRFSSQSNRANL